MDSSKEIPTQPLDRESLTRDLEKMAKMVEELQKENEDLWRELHTVRYALKRAMLERWKLKLEQKHKWQRDPKLDMRIMNRALDHKNLKSCAPYAVVKSRKLRKLKEEIQGITPPGAANPAGEDSSEPK